MIANMRMQLRFDRAQYSLKDCNAKYEIARRYAAWSSVGGQE